MMADQKFGAIEPTQRMAPKEIEDPRTSLDWRIRPPKAAMKKAAASAPAPIEATITPYPLASSPRASLAKTGMSGMKENPNTLKVVTMMTRARGQRLPKT